MWHTFKYTLRMLVKQSSVVIWVILFPLILATLFSAMFKNIDSASFQLDPVSCAVVENDAYLSSDNAAFGQMITALGAATDSDTGAVTDSVDAAAADSESIASQLLNVTYVATESEAQSLIDSGDVLGYLVLDAGGTPSVTVKPVSDSSSMDAIDETILADVADEYIRSRTTLETVATENPAALADSSVIESFYSQADYTRQVAITYNASSQSVRYFYALLGFAAIMAAMIALQTVTRTQPNLSDVGARRAVGAISRSRTLAGALLASWVLSFACLLLAFAYMRFVLGINFGGRDAACIFGLAVAALMTTALGSLIGAIPKIPEGAKGGILTGITCTLSLFAGLYGTPTMNLADRIGRDLPWLAAANPAKKVSDLFYSLYVYTSYDPYFQTVLILLVTTTVFIVVAALLMRRQRYASL